jgi:DNA-directed RNA polymerase specialized sigma24 family protein
MRDLPTPAGMGDAPPLSRAEIDNAIKSLTGGEKAAIVKIAKYFEWSLFEATELIQEAYLRILDGRRKWPRGLSAPAFFYWVMRGIAGEWAKKRKREVPNEAIDIEDEGAEERGILAKFDVMKIIALFDDDPIAKKIVVAEMDGARGEELLKLSGLSLVEYETKRRKIRRRIDRLKAEKK